MGWLPGYAPLVLSTKVYRAAAFTLGAGASTTISWDTEAWDDNGLIAVTSTDLTLSAGRWHVAAASGGSSIASTEYLQQSLTLGGVSVAIGPKLTSPTSGQAAYTFVEGWFTATAGQVLTSEVYNNSGSSRAGLTGQAACWLYAERIGN